MSMTKSALPPPCTVSTSEGLKVRVSAASPSAAGELEELLRKSLMNDIFSPNRPQNKRTSSLTEKQGNTVPTESRGLNLEGMKSHLTGTDTDPQCEQGGEGVWRPEA